MADKNVNIKITADSKHAQKGIDKTTSSLNKLNKEVKNDSVTKLKNAWDSTASTIKGAGLGAIIAAEVKILKEELKAIKETAEAFNVQLRAETNLATAAKNNPFLNSDSVEQLKKFASELQKIGTYGDEELIPMMSVLAASGRDQNQIMQIMKAGLDIAAGSGENLDSVVKNLNKTLNGEAGEIADLVPEIKNLTKEQLLNGDAIAIAAKQYAGMSEEAANAVGSAKQLEMAQGDLKETIGSITQPAYNAWNNFWLKQTQKAQTFFDKVNDWLDAIADFNFNLSIKGDYSKWVKDTIQESKEQENTELFFNHQVNAQTPEAVTGLKQYLDNKKHLSKEEEELLKQLTKEDEANKNAEKWAKLNAELKKAVEELSPEELEKRAKELSTTLNSNVSLMTMLPNEIEKLEQEQKYVDNRLKKIHKEEEEFQNNLIKKYEDTVNAKKTEIETRRSAGQSITKETELQDMLNTKLSAYVEFIRSGGDANSQKAKKIRDDIKSIGGDLEDLEQKRKDAEQAEEDARKAKEDADKKEKERLALIKDQLDAMNEKVIALKSSAMELLGEHEDEVLLSDTISATITQLEKEADALDKTGKAYNDYIEKIKELKALLPQVQKAEEEATKGNEKMIDKVQSVMETFASSLQSLSDSITSICETYIGAEKRKYDKDAESLELQLDKNIITYDQYLEKRNALDKQFAEKEYNIKMAEWSMNLATATAQAALSVVNALASGTPPVNIINAVTAGLLGAAQITAIAGAKPPKPSFSTGGFLTGNSYHGDKIPFNGNAGEAILNPAEQRNFLDLANGNFNGGVSLVQPINIVNNAGDSVAVSASTQDRQIKITVDKIVNSGLQSGTYNNGLQSANANMKGARYL